MPIPGVTVEDVDAYSDVSNGSTISVDSVASEDNERMPRPPTGGSKRSKSAQSQRSRVGSQFKVSSKEHAPKPSARNLWITAMRNGTASLSTENRPMKTLAGSRATTSKLAKSGSRTQHFRDLVVIDNLKSRNHVRSASLSASEPQLMGAGPAYKPQEDYYDEVIELKKVINALKAENNIISTKLRRVEGENILKDRKMEDLLNQRKQPEDVRRTLTDKKGDTSAIVNSLKQKLHGVERTVKDKETELSQLKKTLKMTNIEELQIQSETYYQEIQRLQLVILEMQQAQVHDHFGKSSPSFREHKGKPSTMTLKRLADENDHLKAENRGLKKDLLSAIETSADGSKVPLKADYADMSRGQLLAKIHELEEKILKPGEEKRKGSLYEEDKEEGEKSRRSSSASSVAKLTEGPGRVQLKGSTSQKLAQLQEREVELLEEREKQREVIERLKEDRAHYRLVADDLRMQLQFTQEELDTFRGEKGSVENQRRSSTASSTGSRKLSVKEVIRPPVDDDEDGMGSMLKEFQQKRAAKTLQREWRGYQGRKQRVMEEKEREEENRQNEAAATLQKNWRRHRERAKEIEVKEKEEAITEIQAALRGQAVRSKYIEKLDKELELTDRDDAVVAIQSAMRAHLSRKKHVEEPGYELISRDFRTRGSSSNVVPGSEPNDDEGLVSRPTNFRQPEAAMTGLRRSSLSESAHDKALVPAPLKRNETRAPKALPRIKRTARDQNSTARDAALVVGGEAHATKSHPSCNGLARSKEESTRDHSRDQSLSALDRALNSSVVARDDAIVGKELAHDQARDLIAHTPGLSESDSDDNAIVIGRSSRGRTKRKSDVKTDLISSEPVDDTKDTVTVNKESFVVTPQTSRGKKKTARKESKKSKINDVSREEEGSRSRLISAPRFSNISEQSEDEDIRMHKSSRSRLDESPHESAHRETQQEPKTKTFKVVDSDDDDDDDVVIPSRRTLDTGVSQKRPSLSSSTRGVNPPSRREEKARPALSRSSQRENGQRIRSKGFEVVDSDDDEDNAVVMPSRRALDTGVSQKRPSLSSFNQGVNPPSRSEDKTRPALSRSSQRENGQRIRSKGLEVVDSDDDEDDAVVMPSRRALDTGVSHQRPSLSLSNRERSPPGGKEDKIRPGLSRTSGKLTASRDVEKSEVDSVQSVQRPGLSRSTRPLSAKKSRKDRFDRAASDEEENKRVTGWRQSGAPAGSEDDSDGDGVVVMGRKAKTGSGGAKTGGRSSLTRKSPATAVSAPPKRETFSDSLDNFFSSSKDANNKKPVRKTSVRVNEDDDNDDDDDDDDIVVSSSSKHKSRQKEAPRKDSRDSVADLWATSEKKGTLKKGKSSSKSPKNTWNPDFEFGKPPRRPESQLDEMF
ncbi:trichohyalin-like isoform X3 [Acropora millepora]|uniref:trichohyalin-like isoform X3 n=1 Tax=Acropora millepora TaxID=45264 RepID=UPI001CF1456B|nr:trichohyalin-like isoform X3 [Acropora millepora]